MYVGYTGIAPIHAALDFAPVPRGLDYLPVGAARPGLVDRIVQHPELGNVVVLRHYWQVDVFYTWYCHLAQIKVAVGNEVRARDIIAYAGHTGYTIPTGKDGTHLHFVWSYPKYGEKGLIIANAMDPLPYLVAG